jgi:predicted 3-demethylubiquinone-9 3-methyltransferase (glyoxalase superfamily)
VQKIIPCLWFDDQAEEATQFYASIFKDAKIGNVACYDEASSTASGKPVGSVMTVEFQLHGQDFLALNGGPMFKFTEAVSFIVNCDSQDEVDEFWEKLSADGQIQQCGWLKDKYGLSWQIVPVAMNAMLIDTDPEKAKRVMEAMLEMTKLDLNVLQAAYDADA